MKRMKRKKLSTKTSRCKVVNRERDKIPAALISSMSPIFDRSAARIIRVELSVASTKMFKILSRRTSQFFQKRLNKKNRVHQKRCPFPWIQMRRIITLNKTRKAQISPIIVRSRRMSTVLRPRISVTHIMTSSWTLRRRMNLLRMMKMIKDKI